MSEEREENPEGRAVGQRAGEPQCPKSRARACTRACGGGGQGTEARGRAGRWPLG